jgi:hypothetical protein
MIKYYAQVGRKMGQELAGEKLDYRLIEQEGA